MSTLNLQFKLNRNNAVIELYLSENRTKMVRKYILLNLSLLHLVGLRKLMAVEVFHFIYFNNI